MRRSLTLLPWPQLDALRDHLFHRHGMRWPAYGDERRAIAAFCDARDLWPLVALARHGALDAPREPPRRAGHRPILVMRPHQVLYQLLLELFDDNVALTIFLGFEGRDPRLLHALPGSCVSRSDFTFKAVSALESRGLVDTIFFGRLLDERPGQRRAIVGAASAYGVTLALAAP